MTILHRKTVWRKSVPTKRQYELRVNRLTPDEQANVRFVLRWLRVRYGSWAAMSTAMKTDPKAVENALSKRRGIGAGLALRVARLAGAQIEDVLTGRFPKPGMCPMCGRGPA
jgi:hypothetical protein